MIMQTMNVEDVVDELRKLDPPFGFGFAEVGVMVKPKSFAHPAYEVWQLHLIGPIGVITDERWVVGGDRPFFTWRIDIGDHGTLESATPEGLVEEARRWCSALRGRPWTP